MRKLFKGMSEVAVKIEQLPDDIYPSSSMSRYTINSEPVLLGPPAGKTGAGYRWTVRQGWVVRENGKQIAAFATEQEAMVFREGLSADEDDAPGALLFRIFKLQSDGHLHFVESVQTLDDAKGRVRELGAVWPGVYVIDNEETTERVFISTRTCAVISSLIDSPQPIQSTAFNFSPLISHLTNSNGCGILHQGSADRGPFRSSFPPQLKLSPRSPRAISPLSTAFTPNRSLTPLSTAFTQIHRGVGYVAAGLNVPDLQVRLPHPERIYGTLGRSDLQTLSRFRINTCKSVSKQRTLTRFRINTCEKTGEGGRLSLTSVISVPLW
jgi:hypothetical protein